MHEKAIAFDFDGTLIQGGKYNLDKGVHILFSAWTACFEHGLDRFVHPENVQNDTDIMLRAYLNYPGAPRFQQLAAIVNALANGVFTAPEKPRDFGFDSGLLAAYERVCERYNKTYSDLNDTAARYHWKPYPSVKNVLRRLSADFDLYIASGVTADILEHDFELHGFARRLFHGIFGGNASGGNDKGTILRSIRKRGYDDLLFVGDSNKDLQYALDAGAKFFRIRTDNDYKHLLESIAGEFPHQNEFWEFSEAERAFLKDKTRKLLEDYVSGQPLSLKAMTDWINT